MAFDDDCTPGICRDFQQRRYVGGLYRMGHENLYGRYFLYWHSDFLPADFHGFGTGEDQSFDGVSAETGAVDSADFPIAVFLLQQGIWSFCG